MHMLFFVRGYNFLILSGAACVRIKKFARAIVPNRSVDAIY